ncbi:MAG TPA: DUF5615 family PIN-like protein [Thermoanaerobaculia bacterium]|nr:DUF5615 family PIN-like protein [Thermoanaerobaculia bacterium]
MLRLYLDHNLHGLVAGQLRARGVDVVTAFEDGRHELSDPLLLDRAEELGRVFVSHDRHLLREAARRNRLGIEFRGVVYCHQDRLVLTAFDRRVGAGSSRER